MRSDARLARLNSRRTSCARLKFGCNNAPAGAPRGRFVQAYRREVDGQPSHGCRQWTSLSIYLTLNSTRFYALLRRSPQRTARLSSLMWRQPCMARRSAMARSSGSSARFRNVIFARQNSPRAGPGNTGAESPTGPLAQANRGVLPAIARAARTPRPSVEVLQPLFPELHLSAAS
jgi:hypothetical protein